VTGSRQPLLGASVSGSSAWIIAMLLREVLPARIRQLEVDPHISGGVVRDLRGTAAAIQEAARQYRELVDGSPSVPADSAERSLSASDADLRNPPQVGVAEVAVMLNCGPRWVTTLCRMGQLAATKQGREWRIDVSSVEDYKAQGVKAA
jgi:excisionase family DNA binding protein